MHVPILFFEAGTSFLGRRESSVTGLSLAGVNMYASLTYGGDGVGSTQKCC
jgi:hypothetical protein